MSHPMFAHRLLLLTEAFPPQVGGIQEYLSELLGALPPADSFVVAPQTRGARAWDEPRAYRVLRARTRAWTYPRWRKAWQAARRLVRDERIEAVICGKGLFEGRAAMLLQDEFRIPFVVCTYAMEVRTWLKQDRTRRQLLKVLHRASRVVVINEDTKRTLQSLGVPQRRLVKIYPGVSEDFFKRSPAEGVEFRRTLQEKRVVTSVARLVPRKGLDVLLEAFAEVVREVPKAHLLIVGDGPERENLKALVRGLDLSVSVTFVGAATREVLIGALDCAELFALTPVERAGETEGFGIVYLEAAARGKTAVASRVGGIPEAVLDDRTGLLVPPGDQRATAEAIVKLLRDSDTRLRLASEARARAEKDFHWTGRALLFQGMVDSLLAERRP